MTSFIILGSFSPLFRYNQLDLFVFQKVEMDLEAQKNRYHENWKQYLDQFGTAEWKSDPDFLYFIDIPVEGELAAETEDIARALVGLASEKEDQLKLPEEFHITLALPGRLGVHFQGNEEGFMKKELEGIMADFEPFEIQLGDLNCFPNVLFREVYDPSEKLYELHTRISQVIPFAQNPDFQFEKYLPHLSILYANLAGGEILKNDDFSRKLGLLTLKVDRIQFGKAKGAFGGYEREVLLELGVGGGVGS